MYTDEPPIGRAFLEYCYSEIFNIRRFPGYENYYIKGSSNCRWLVETNQITEKDIRSACKQLEALYAFTQKTLEKRNCKSLKLCRTLRNYEVKSLERIGDGELRLNANIISSYAYDSSTAYGTKVRIVRNIDCEDIVMVDDITAFPDDATECGQIVHTGEFEVWVLNKNMYGKIYIDETDIVEDPYQLTKAIPKQLLREHKYENEEGSLKELNMAYPRPCEWNAFTKRLISRNKKKIEELYR